LAGPASFFGSAAARGRARQTRAVRERRMGRLGEAGAAPLLSGGGGGSPRALGGAVGTVRLRWVTDGGDVAMRDMDTLEDVSERDPAALYP
jgi:hypothetical protein